MHPEQSYLFRTILILMSRLLYASAVRIRTLRETGGEVQRKVVCVQEREGVAGSLGSELFGCSTVAVGVNKFELSNHCFLHPHRGILSA